MKSDCLKKIVHIISNLSIGGAQLLLYDILKNIESEYQIYIVTIDSGHYIEKFRTHGFNVIDIKCKGLINPLIYFKLKKIIKKIKPDVVHTHLLKADFYGRLAAKNLKVPLIISTCHNDSTIHKVSRNTRKNIFDHIDNWIIDFTNSYIVAISEKVKEYLIERKNGSIASRIKVIYNGIDVSKEKFLLNRDEIVSFKNSMHLKEDDIVIVIVGRLEEQKGHLDFLRSVIPLIKKYNLKILILGEGSKRVKIENFIGNEKLDKNIFLYGFIDETQKYFEISDICVIPSIWEGFGIVACEAMLKGKIVLASNVGGLKEIIDDGIDGYLYSLGNEKELNEKLECIILNYQNLKSVGLAAISKVKDKFNIETNAKEYFELYKEKLKFLRKSE